MRRLVLLLGLAAWLAIPAIGLWRVRGATEEAVLRHGAPTWVSVRRSTEGEVIARGLHLRWEVPAPLVAPPWSGLLAELTVRPGQRVTDGDVVAVVDQVERVAVASRRPFTRSLALGARGDDVADLNAFLGRHGFESGPATEFTSDTWRGVNRFSATIGLAPTPIFDPAWVLHLGHSGATVSTVVGSVGAPAPSAGERIATFDARLVSARVIPVQPELAPSDGQAPAGSGSDGSDHAAATAADRRLAAVEAAGVPEGFTLRVGEVDLAVDEARTSIARGSLVALRQHADGAPYLEVTIQRPPGPRLVEVPAAAVYAGDVGGSCVLVRRSGRTEAVPVQVVGGSVGRTIVTGADSRALQVGDRVAVGVAGSERTCR